MLDEEITVTPHTLEKMFENFLRKLFGSTPQVDDTVFIDNEMRYDGGSLAPTVEPDPLPVNIVSSKPTVVVQRGTLNWTGDKTLVRTGQAQQLVGMIPYRRSVTLVHQGALNIAIGPTSAIRFGGVGNVGSFELRPGDTLTLDTRGEIWAIADGASAGESIGIIQTIEEGVGN